MSLTTTTPKQKKEKYDNTRERHHVQGAWQVSSRRSSH